MFKATAIGLSLAVIFTSFPVSAQNNLPSATLAILDLEANGVSPSLAAILTERLNQFFYDQRRYRLVERNHLQKVLREQSFQHSGLCGESCTELGKLLGVRQLMLGSVSKVGNLYSLNLRLVDVTNGQIRGMVSGECRCSEEEFVTRLSRQVAGELLSQAPTHPDLAHLRVISYPPKAEVRLNQRLVGLTPLSLADVAPGDYQLEVRQADHAPVQRPLKLVAGESVSEVASLRKYKGYGELEVSSVPMGASVYLNQELKGVTPLTLAQIPEGDHHLRLTLAGHRTTEQRILVFANESAREAFHLTSLLPAPGRVKLTSTPPGAQIILNGVERGLTPKTLQIPAGWHVLTLEQEGYESLDQQSVYVDSGKLTELDLQLTPRSPEWLVWTTLGVGVTLIFASGLIQRRREIARGLSLAGSD
jgi:hypothetical protein